MPAQAVAGDRQTGRQALGEAGRPAVLAGVWDGGVLEKAVTQIDEKTA